MEEHTNLLDAHPPFQIDGNFGCTSGIAEMLMQSSDGAIYLLPALPDVWKTGTISGLRAKGGFEIVEMQWKDEKVIKVVVKSVRGGNLRLRMPNEMRLNANTILREATGLNPNQFYQLTEITNPVTSPSANIEIPNLKPTHLYDIATEAGKIYTLNGIRYSIVEILCLSGIAFIRTAVKNVSV